MKENEILMPGIIDMWLDFNPEIEDLTQFTLTASQGGVTTVVLDINDVKDAVPNGRGMFCDIVQVQTVCPKHIEEDAIDLTVKAYKCYFKTQPGKQQFVKPLSKKHLSQLTKKLGSFNKPLICPPELFSDRILYMFSPLRESPL